MESFNNNHKDNMPGNGAQKRPKNIYARGADDGFIVGLYVVVMFVLMAVGQRIAIAGIPLMAMFLGMPFLVYYLLRRTYRATYGMCMFSALWMQGIVTFACASLFYGAVAFIYMKWVDPDFLKNIFEMVAEAYKDAPQESSRMLAEESELLLKRGVMPPISQVVMSLMWMVVFSGSILSMACAMFVKIVGHIKSIKKRQ